MGVDKPIVPTEIRTIYKGRVFNVVAETITLRRGQSFTVEIIRHPPSVVIVPVADDGRIVLVRQYRHAVGAWMWELPAGSTDPGETPEAAARRECHEEVGLIPATVARIGRLYPTPGYCDEEMVFLTATGLRPPGPEDDAAHADEDEDLEVQAFTLEEVARAIDEETITDMKTVAGMAMLRRQRA